MKNKLIRTFLSVPVPMELKKKKNMLFSTFENCSAKINWVKSNNLHLTLKFIGYTQESFIDKIINAIQPITNKPLNSFQKTANCLIHVSHSDIFQAIRLVVRGGFAFLKKTLATR